MVTPSETDATGADQVAEDDSQDQGSSQERRNFVFGIASIVMGAITGIIPAAIGLWTAFDPLGGRKAKPKLYAGSSGGKEGYHRIASLDSLTEGGAPQRFPVIADQQDAWNFVPDQPIGAVYIQWTKGTDVRVFNATCPHAGCSVAFRGEAFHCPCHNSAFDLDGSKLESGSGRANPSPRPMDSLQVDGEKLEADGEIWVEFKNFYTGRPEQIPKS